MFSDLPLFSVLVNLTSRRMHVIETTFLRPFHESSDAHIQRTKNKLVENSAPTIAGHCRVRVCTMSSEFSSKCTF
jgi:acyl-ACP thioesterase